MAKRFQCEECGKEFRSQSGGEWHISRFHSGDTSGLKKGSGPLSLSELLLIDIAKNEGVLERNPGLKAMVQMRARVSSELSKKKMLGVD